MDWPCARLWFLILVVVYPNTASIWSVVTSGMVKRWAQLLTPHQSHSRRLLLVLCPFRPQRVCPACLSSFVQSTVAGAIISGCFFSDSAPRICAGCFGGCWVCGEGGSLLLVVVGEAPSTFSLFLVVAVVVFACILFFAIALSMFTALQTASMLWSLWSVVGDVFWNHTSRSSMSARARVDHLIAAPCCGTLTG